MAHSCPTDHRNKHTHFFRFPLKYSSTNTICHDRSTSNIKWEENGCLLLPTVSDFKACPGQSALMLRSFSRGVSMTICSLEFS